MHSDHPKRPPLNNKRAEASLSRRPGPRPTVCSACHVAKIRCDRKNPCSNCEKRNIQCIFESSPRSTTSTGNTYGKRRSSSSARRLPKASSKDLLPPIAVSSGPVAKAIGGSSSVVESLAPFISEPSGQQNLYGASTEVLTTQHVGKLAHDETKAKRTSPSEHPLSMIWMSSSSSSSPDSSDSSNFIGFKPRELLEQREEENGEEGILNEESDVALSVCLPPSSEYTCQTWYDNLISFFGPDPYTSRKRVQNLLFKAHRHMSVAHRFELNHISAALRAIASPEVTQAAGAAFIYTLVAIGLRSESLDDRPHLVPCDALWCQDDGVDISMVLQEAAEIFLVQASTNATYLTLDKLMMTAFASAHLMKLQPELSDKATHYLELTRALIRSPLLLSYMRQDSVPLMATTSGRISFPVDYTVRKRSCIRREEAARLRLFSFWSLIHLGSLFPNVELPQLKVQPSSLVNVPITLPWPASTDEANGVEEIVSEDDTRRVRFLLEGLQTASNGILSWHIPQSVDYVNPEKDFERLLTAVEDSAEWMRTIQIMISKVADSKAEDAVALQRYVARYCIVSCHLVGLVIRRIGFFHSEKLRPAAIAALKELRRGGDSTARSMAASQALKQSICNNTYGSRGTTEPAWLHALDAPHLDSWVKLLTRLAGDLQKHQISHHAHLFSNDMPFLPERNESSSACIATSESYYLDSLTLYVAATAQYSHGVKQLYSLLGHPAPHSISIVLALDSAASNLRAQIENQRRTSLFRDTVSYDPSFENTITNV